MVVLSGRGRQTIRSLYRIDRFFTIPVIAVVLCFICYGCHLTGRGFFGEEWTFLWAQQHLDWSQWTDFIGVYRPVSSALWHWIAGHILGDSLLAWNLFALGARILLAFSFWWLVRMLWPQRKEMATITTLFLTVHPALTVTTMSVVFSYYFIELSLILISFAATAVAIRYRKKFWSYYVLSWLTYGISVTYSEYFILLELVRPFIIGLIIPEEQRWFQRVKNIWRFWLPFLVILFGYLVARFLFFEATNSYSNLSDSLRDFFSYPIGWIIFGTGRAISDALNLWWVSWGNAVSGEIFQRYVVGWMLISGVLTAFGMRRAAKRDVGATGREWRSAIIFGGMMTVFGMLPLWFAYIPAISLGSVYDRFALGGLAGAAIVTGGLVISMTRQGKGRGLLTVLLVMGAVAYHTNVSDRYASHWALQQQLYSGIEAVKPKLEGRMVFLDAPEFLEFEPLVEMSGEAWTSAFHHELYSESEGTGFRFGVVSVDHWAAGGNIGKQMVCGIRDSVSVNARTITFTGCFADAVLLHFDRYTGVEVFCGNDGEDTRRCSAAGRQFLAFLESADVKSSDLDNEGI